MAWWRAEANANDSVGTNQATATGALSYGGGEVGQAFALDGSSAYLTLPPSPALNVGAAEGFTVELWAKPDDLADHPFLGWNSPASGYGVGLWIWGGKLNVDMYETNGTAHGVAAAIAQVAGTWQHAAFTYTKTNGQIALFFNGTSLGSFPVGSFTPETRGAMVIGAGPGSYSASRFKGMLDEVSLYNRALAASEIAAIYNAGSAGKCAGGQPPSITAQPQPQTVPAGSNATFSVTATGTAPLSYQWYKSVISNQWSVISDATNTTLVLANVQLADAGNYDVVVSNPYGSVTSAPPAALTVLSGGITFSDGTFNNADWDLTTFASGGGGTSAGVQVGTGGNPGSFRQVTMTTGNSPVTYTGSFGFHRRIGASYNPQTQGAIVAFDYSEDAKSLSSFQMTGLALRQGTNVFTISGSETRETSWTSKSARQLVPADFFRIDPAATNLVDWSTHPDFSAAGLPLEFGFARRNGAPAGTGGYTTVVGIDNWSVTVWPANGGTPPTIVAQPQPQTVPAGSNATFNVTATGTTPLSYQWYKSVISNQWSVISGATNATLTLTNVQLADAGSYDVVVSNALGSVTSAPPAVLSLVSGDIAFFDDTFSDTNWTLTVLTLDTGGAQGAAQAAAGGNPGAYRRITNSVNLPSASTNWSGVYGFHKRAGTYNPQVQGAIAAVDYSEDFIDFSTGGAKTGPALWQDGKLYRWSYRLLGSETAWSNKPILALAATNFCLVTTNLPYDWDPNIHPDFSTQGTPINFGFFSYDEATYVSGGKTYIFGLDNWSVKVWRVISDAPIILSPPTNQVVAAGSNASFAVVATGALPLSYQWRRGGNALPAKTNATLALSNVQLADAGSYDVVVSNALGSATSAPPATLSLVSGDIAFFDDTFSDTNWTLTVIPLNGAGASSAKQLATGGNPGAYRMVTNKVNAAASSTNYSGVVGYHERSGAVYDPRVQGAIIAIDYSEDSIMLASTRQPTGPALSQGGRIYRFAGYFPNDVAAWTRKTTNGLTASQFMLTDPTKPYPGVYDASVHPDFSAQGGPITFGFFRHTEAYGNVLPDTTVGGIDNWSVKVWRVISDTPIILSPPTNQVVVAGSNATFSVVATGALPLGYQWRRSGNALPAKTNATLALSNVQLADAGSYDVVVSNALGSVTSAPPATLSLVSGDIAFFDDTFSDTNWTLTVATIDTGGSQPTVQSASGGNPGAYRRITTSLNTASSGSTYAAVYGFHCRSNATYNPRISGAISSVDYACDSSALGSGGSGTGPAVWQGGRIYRWTSRFTSYETAWTGKNAAGLAAANFVLLDTNQPYLFDYTKHPDFTAQGAPMQFGFFAADEGSYGNGAWSYLVGMDNWSVKVWRVISAAPVILTSPTNQVVVAGSSASFIVVASGAAPLSYQWRREGTTLPTQTNATITLTNVQLADAGSYDVVVSNALGSVTSAPPATLTVLSGAVTLADSTFADPDWDITVLTGGNGGSSSGTQMASGGNPGSFRRVGITLNAASATNSSQVLAFHRRIGATWNPQTQGAIAALDYSEDIRLSSVGQAGGIALRQQGKIFWTLWNGITNPAWSNWTARLLYASNFSQYISGAQLQTVPGSLPDFSTNGALIEFGFFRFNANSPGGGAGSTATDIDNWSVTIWPANGGQQAPSITAQPQSHMAPVSSNATFSVTATGTAPLSYQWRRNSGNLPAQTNATLTLTNVQLADAGNYDVVVTNPYGAVTSAPPATLTVLNGITFMDGTFNDADWELTTFTTGAGGTTTALQAGTGGNPGAFRQITIVVGRSPVAYTAVASFNRRIGATYNPQTQGPILAIDYSEDIKSLSDWQATGPALRQGTNFYFCLGLDTQQTFWTNKTLRSLGATNFQRIDTSTTNLVGWSSHPDFSAAGLPIDFGFCRDNSSTIGAGNGYTTIAGIDNWSLTVWTVNGVQQFPSITAQPQSQTNLVGAGVSFLVTATGAAPLSYQWYKSVISNQWAMISDATNATLTLANLQLADAGNYDVVVGNALGSVTSAPPATLTVLKATPMLTWSNPAAITYGTGLGSNQLNATASVPGAFAYTPPGGSVPNAGTNTLSVVFTPTDAVSFNSVTGSVALVVLNASLNVTANNASRPYGSTNPVFTATIVGLTNGDNITVSNYCSATPASPAGTYAIVPGLVDPNNRRTNYTVSLTSGTLTVTPTQPEFVSQVIAWGNNAYGQTNVPADLGNVVAIEASFVHNLALRADGRMVGWGYNADGRAAPPAGESNVVAIAAGTAHGLGLRANGTVFSWGVNSYTNMPATNVPPNLTNVTAISAGSYHNLALRRDGTVVGWGNNADGQTNIPPGLADALAVAAGTSHCVALKADGTVVAWGRNVEGQCTPPPGLSNVVAIRAGSSYSLGLRADGTVAAWGTNSNGQLTVPGTLSNVVALGGKYDEGYAIRQDGTVVAWGVNDTGQTNVPVSLGGALAADGGRYHSLMLRQISSLPVITVQPHKVNGVSGGSAAFTVMAAGGAPLSYQWQCNGTNLADNARVVGAQSNRLTLANLSVDWAADYQVVIGNVYGSVTSTVATLTVLKTTPALTWSNPAAISYGTALGSNQLNATASVPGTFAYTPPAGTVPNTGTSALSVVFAPTDALRFNSVTGSVALVVQKAALNVTANNATRAYGVTNPLFTGTLTGVTNGDPITATYSCTATPACLPGAYAIVPSLVDPAGRLSNYFATLQNGTLTVTTAPPQIVSQPLSLAVPVGANASLSVGASGTPPMAYQWRLNGGLLAGATGNTLGFASAQLTNSGNYDVVVTNVAGSVTSQVATITVTNVVTARVVRVLSATNWPGGLVELPLELMAQGDENTVVFSLAFDPSLLIYQSNALGTGVLAGAQMIVNTNSAGQGRIGVLFGLPSGAAFTSGARQFAVMTFQIAAGITTATNLAVEFGNQPVAPEVGSVDADVLPAQFVGGTVAVTPGYEGDVSPRLNGDGRLTGTDWTLIGRFVAGLSTISNASEFARADCAPRSTLGDGRISGTDWTQAGRYVVGLDAPRSVGGPSTPALSLFSESFRQGKDDPSGRLLRLVGVATSPDGQVAIPLELVSAGDENTLAFSVTFEPSALSYDSVVRGPALPFNAQLILNTNSAGSGRLGVLLGLPAGSAFVAGTQQVLTVSLRTNSPTGITETAVAFGDSPVLREVGSAAAEVLPADYVSAMISLGAIEPPHLSISLEADGQLKLLLNGAPGAICRVEFLGELGATNWSPLTVVTLENTNAVVVNPQPGSNQARFYRAVRLP